MATRREKVEAGLFLLISAALLFTVLFFIIGMGVSRETASYYVAFQESVGNLKENSPVSFKGVPVGNVGDIELSPDMTEIMVELELKQGTLITENVQAELKFNFLTQIYYIELALDKSGGAVLPPGAKISPRNTRVEQIVERIPELQSTLAVFLKQLNQLFGAENLETFGAILTKLDGVLTVAPDKIDKIENEWVAFREGFEKSLDRIVVQVESLAGRVDSVARNTETFLDVRGEELGALLAELEGTAREARGLLAELRGEPSRMLWPDGGQRLDRVLAELRRAVEEAAALLADLRKEPSRVVWPDRVPERKTPD